MEERRRSKKKRLLRNLDVRLLTKDEDSSKKTEKKGKGREFVKKGGGKTEKNEGDLRGETAAM